MPHLCPDLLVGTIRIGKVQVQFSAYTLAVQLQLSSVAYSA